MNILLQGTQASPGHHALLCALLQSWGHSVQQAPADGAAPGPLADVLLLDLDAAAARRPSRPQIAIGLATWMDADTTQRGNAAGLHSLVAKPVHPATLRAALEAACPVQAAAPSFDYAHALTLADAWIVSTIAPAVPPGLAPAIHPVAGRPAGGGRGHRPAHRPHAEGAGGQFPRHPAGAHGPGPGV